LREPLRDEIDLEETSISGNYCCWMWRPFFTELALFVEF